MAYRYNVNTGIQKLKTKTFIAVSALGLVLGASGMSLLAFSTAHADAETCHTVFTSTKGTLTAAQVGGNVNGDLDAGGCDIGVYYSGTSPGNVTTGATIHDANQYGVFVDGNAGNATVNVNGADIYNIGNHTADAFAPNGDQTGLDVYFDGNASGSVSGNVSGNTIGAYQKGGVVISGSNASAIVNDNSIVGLSNVPFIAQNGIEFGYGATGSASGNTINGNWYTGANWSSTGLLLFDVSANQVKTSNNNFMNNQNNLAVVTAQSCPHQYGGIYETYGLCTYTP